MLHNHLVAILFAFAALALPLIAPAWLISFAAIALAKALVALGIMLLMRGGLVPFGHALYYCLGAYAAALAGRWFGWRDGFVLLACALLASLLTGAAIGLILRRYRAIFFAMLSLAFSMILYGTLLKTQGLGSSDGISLPRPTFFGASGGVLSIYIVAACCVAIAWIGVQAYMRTSIGQLAPALHDNEVRLQYLGVSVNRVIHFEYVLSAGLAGLAGGLVALAVGQIDPSLGYWTTSGEFVFIAILGGVGGAWAPVSAALLFEALHAVAFAYSPHGWRLLLGGALILLILFLPKGLSSLAHLRWRAA